MAGIDVEKMKQRVPSMSVSQLRVLIKDIYDERKHNRTMTETDKTRLKDLEKAVDAEIEKRKTLSADDQKDYSAWKQRMDKEKRCY
jgi:hypothetical protein